MILLDGKKTAEARKQLVQTRARKFFQKTGRKPHLAVVLIGADPASEVYVRNKVRACAETEIEGSLIRHPSLTENELKALLTKLNNDPQVDGVLVQLPMPKPLNEDTINSILLAEKDVDGLTYANIGRLQAQTNWIGSCTPAGIIHLLEDANLSLQGLEAVVVGRSQIVGLPMAQMLIQKNATVTVCHSKTEDLRSHTKRADLVIVAAGKPWLLGRDDFKKDAIVVDVGIHRVQVGEQPVLRGDVNPTGLETWVKALTPVPGGVGPMTIATLMENLMTLAERKAFP